MRAECIEAVQKAGMALMGKTLSATDARKVGDNISGALITLSRRDRDAFMKMTKQEQLEAAAELATQDLIHQAAKSKQRAEMQIVKDRAITSIVQAAEASGKSKLGVLSRLLNTFDDGQGRFQSAEDFALGKSAEWKSQLLDLMKLEQGSLLNIFADKKGIYDFAKEAKGVDSGNPLAKQAAQKYKMLMDSVIDQLNAKGFDIGKLADYGLPQTLDVYKLRGTEWFKKENLAKAKTEFVEFAMKHVDRLKYMELDGTFRSDESMRKFLDEAFMTMVTEGEYKQGQKFGGDIAQRHRAHRQLFWKDADAYIAVMDKYGSGSPYQMITSQLDQLGKDYAMAHQFGPYALDYLKTKSVEFAKDDLARGIDSTTDFKAFNSMVDWFVGGSDPVANYRVHKIFSDMKAYMASVYLGSMPLSQLADQHTSLAQARSWGIPITSLYRETVELAKSGEYRDLIRSNGAMLESATNGVQRMTDVTNLSGTAGGLASILHKISLASGMTNVTRGAFFAGFANHLGSMVQRYKSFDDLLPGDKAKLEQYGITSRDFEVWKRAGVDDMGSGKTFLGIRNFDKMTTKDVMDLVKPELKGLSEQHAEIIARMEEKNAVNMEWLGKRAERLNDYKAKLERWIEAFEETRVERLDKMEQGAIEQGGKMWLRIEKAKLDMEIAKQLAEEKLGNKTESINEQLKRGAEWFGRRRQEIAKTEPSKVVTDIFGYLETKKFTSKLGDKLDELNFRARQYGETALSKAEELGARRAWLEIQMKEADKRLAKAQKQASKEVAKKAVEMEKRFDAATREFDQFAARVDEMMANRALVVENFEKQIGRKVEQIAQDAIDDSRLKLISMIQHEAHLAVLSPTARTSDAFRVEGGKGKIVSELAALATQFKAFPVAYFTRHLIERARNTELSAMGNPIVHRLQLAALSGTFGALALWANDIASGRDPRRLWTEGKPGETLAFGTQAWLKGGGLGVFGDILFGVDWLGRDPSMKVLGPTYGFAASALQVGQAGFKTVAGTMTGEEFKGSVAKESVELFKSSIPFQNLWYTKAALHGIFLNELHELAAPGYKNRIQNMAEKNYHAKYWFNPQGETRAPNLGNIWETGRQ